MRVDGKDILGIARQFVRKFYRFQGRELDSEDERDAATLMKEVFASRQALLIFDNAIDATIKQLCPGGSRCGVIITTRNRNLPSWLSLKRDRIIHLNPLPTEDSLQLLKKILGDEKVEKELEAAYDIIDLVGNLPLALKIVGAALEVRPRSLADYAGSLQEENNRLSRLAIDGDEDLKVEASLNLSLELLEEKEKDFFACLTVCGEESFARLTAMAAGGCEDEWEAEDYLEKLYVLSLLNQTGTEGNRYGFHPLVRVYAKGLAEQRNLLSVAQERHAQFFVDLLESKDVEDRGFVGEVAADLEDVILAAQWLHDRQIQTGESKEKSYQFALKLQPLFEQYGYWQKAITLMSKFQSWAEELEDWNAVVKYQMHEARYRSFAEEFARAESILADARAKLPKIEDLNTRKEREAKLLNVLAGVFEKQRKIEEAIETFRADIRIEEEIGDDRSVAIICNRLGKLLQLQGKLEEAQKAFERGVVIAKFLQDQSSLAIGLNYLGRLLEQQKRVKQAEQTFVRGIAIAEDIKNFSSLIISLTYLAGLLQKQGRLNEAQYLLGRRIGIAKIINDQSSLAIGWNCLGGILKQQENLAAARKAFERGIVIAEAINDQSQLAIGWMCLGGVLEKQGNFQGATKAFEQVITIAGEINDQSQLAIGWNCLRGVLKKQRNLQVAKEAFEKVIVIAEEINDQPQLAIVWNCLGGVLEKQGNFQGATEAFQQVIAIAEAINDKSQLAIGWKCLGGVLDKQGNFQGATEAFQQVIAIAKKINNQSPLAISWKCLGGVLDKQGNFQGAKEAFEQVITIAEAINDQSQLAIAWKCLGRVLEKQENFQGAKEAFEQVITIAETINDQSQLAIAWKCLGRVLEKLERVLEKQGKLQEAKESFEQQIAIAEPTKDQSQLTIAWHCLGGVLGKQRNFQRAKEAFQQQITIAEAANKQSQLAIAWHCLGRVLEKQGNFQEAKEAFQQVIAITKEINDEYEYAWGLHNLARICKLNKNFDKAEILLKQSQEIFEQTKKLPDLAKVMNTLGSVLQKQQKWNEAEEILRQSYDLAVKLEDKLGEAIITNSLGQVMACQRKEKAFELAKMYFKESIKLGKELNNQRHLAKVRTAMGQMFLARNSLEEAMEQLVQGFEIDASLCNIRGLIIVTPLLTDCLCKLSKPQEALAYCQRALNIAPNKSYFSQLQARIEARSLTVIKLKPKLIKTGIIREIKYNPKDKLRWGIISPDDGSAKITFNDKYLGSESISKLSQGALVEVEVKEKYGKLYAKKIRIVERE